MAKFTDENDKVIEFELDKVDRVYSGKPHTCMCGCAGTYYDFPEKRSFIKRIIKKFEEFQGLIENLHDNIFSIEVSETRKYTIYLVNKTIN